MEVRDLLMWCIQTLGIASILDLGCGDWHWMRHVLSEPGAGHVTYAGWDVHEAMIESLQRDHGSTTTSFKVADIFAEQLPGADLVICRDVLFHVDTGLASQLVSRIMESSSKFFLSTSFPGEPANAATIARYLPIDGWGFHRINLDVAPFSLGGRLVRRALEPRCAHKGNERYACVYSIGDHTSSA